MARRRSSQSGRSDKAYILHKPRGQFSNRVQAVGPEHFGIVSFDCAKARSKFMLADFYGTVRIEPTEVSHQHSALDSAYQQIQQACSRYQLRDLLVAIERTGEYHRPVQRFFRGRGCDVRLVHPYASKQFRQPADPGDKTDDKDLGGVHRAATNGFALIDPIWPDDYCQLQFLVRQRRDLVRKMTILQCQIREVLHAMMPGYAECFLKFWESKTAVPLARHTGSAQALRQAGADGLRRLLKELDLRCHPQTLPKILAWAENAPPSHPGSDHHRRVLDSLDDDRLQKIREIQALERASASCLVRTPFVLLLVIPGINVVSSAELAGEMGPPCHYANANAITGRAGLMPSRYQSDRVDHQHGPLRRAGNRKFRAALLQIADNLIRHNHHYNIQTLRHTQTGKDPRWVHVKIAKSFSRLAFAMLTTGQVFGHPSCQQAYSVLDKLLDFHRDHATPWEQVRQDLEAATARLPRSRYAAEAQTLHQRLEEINRQRRPRPQPLSEIIPIVLARLGVAGLQSEMGPG
jgi:transposase